MSQGRYIPGTRILARVLMMVLLLQPLWDVSQHYRWDSTHLRQMLDDLLDLVRPRAAHAAEVNVEVTLAQGFNLFAYPVTVPAGFICEDLQAQLGAMAVYRLNAQTQRVETCETDGTFPIVSCEGYIVEMPAAAVMTLQGEPGCPTVDLAAGLNLLGVPSPLAGLSCFNMLQAMGERTTTTDAVGNFPLGNTNKRSYDSVSRLIAQIAPLDVCFINTLPVLRVLPGSATLQRSFWSRARARRSQGEGTGTGLTKWTSRQDNAHCL